MKQLGFVKCHVKVLFQTLLKCYFFLKKVTSKIANVRHITFPYSTKRTQEIAPATCLHAHWAGELATHLWKNFMREEWLSAVLFSFSEKHGPQTFGWNKWHQCCWRRKPKRSFGCSNVFGTCFRYCSVSKSNRFFMSNLWEERLKISQKLPPSPLPSELLRAASYARRRCASERGGSIVLVKIVGTSNPTCFGGGVLFGIISLCWLHPVDVVSYYYLNFFLVSVDIFLFFLVKRKLVPWSVNSNGWKCINLILLDLCEVMFAILPTMGFITTKSPLVE